MTAADPAAAAPWRWRGAVRLCVTALAVGWAYALCYLVRRETVRDLLPQRELFGKVAYAGQDTDTLARALDWMAVAWVVLPLLLVAAVLVAALVGVGHVTALVVGTLNTPVLPLAGAALPLDPVLAVLALTYGVVVVLAMGAFLRGMAAD